MKDSHYLAILQSYFRTHKRLPAFERVCEMLGFRSK